MNVLVLDAGALIGVDRDDRATVALLLAARQAGMPFRTNANVVAQVWRDDRGRQAQLARLLRSVDIRDVDDRIARRAGALLSATATSDVVDATLVLLAGNGDRIVTSDRADIKRLTDALKISVEIITC